MALTKGIRGTNVFRTAFFLPNLIGGIVLSYVWLMIFNAILQKYDMTIVTTQWTAFWGLVAVVAWQQIGYMMIIYISGIQNIPGELIEAAKIDGAGRWQLIRTVDIPAIMPTAGILLILSMGSVLNVGFDKIFLMQNSLNLPATEVISTYTYKIGILNSQFSYSTAIGLFNTVVNFVFLITANAISKKISETSIF